MDVIDQARDFHTRLAEYYGTLSAETDKVRVKILLDYLGEAEQRHEEALEVYEKQVSHDVTDTWLQFPPNIGVEDYLAPAELTHEMDAEAVLREVLRLDERLSELYREVVKRAHSKRIKEVFTNLLETNEKEMRNLARDFGHMHDW
ncbi:hypothetical protein PDESU_04434 [Pontiella desulfatans]|uniref:Rubrerythrin diiron-binding domain-containing protein n=2 Tax=Pontiella desulfatans TaxID=2750659 RepID=A0A6C2U7Y7_PONDE|nr:hypothetical protein PDESU_04434 [Pontiella desulfatans]